MTRRLVILTGITALFVAGCSITPKDSSPTLKSLEKKTVKIERDAEVKPDLAKAKESYEALLQATTDEKLRRRAMRRLADLELQDREEPGVETAKAETPAPAAGKSASTEPDYRKAITLYEGLLRSYPDRKDNDKVMYQLSRAYELVGELEKSYDTLTDLVKKYPQTIYYEESQFRRGELLFGFREYAEAEVAYRESLRSGKRSPFHERATYKLGWTVYKQERYKDALPYFFALVDLKLANKRLGDNLLEYDFLSRGDKELLLDAFRVISLCFFNLEGTNTLKTYFPSGEAPNYEFLVYRNLGDFHLKQERFLEASDAYAAFGGVRPEHPQGLLLLIDAIELNQEKGRSDLVLEHKKTLATRYGKYVEYWATHTHHGFNEYLMRSNDQMEQRIEEYIVTTLEELGRFYHNRAQKTKNPLDYAEAIKWYQTFLRTFLQHQKSPEINFLLAEALYEDGRYAEAIREYEKTAYNYRRHGKGAEAGYAALLAYEAYKKQLEGEDLEFWNRLSIQSAQRFSKLFPKDPRTATVLVKLVDDLFKQEQYAQASEFAKRILVIAPEDDIKARRQATIILAHTAFDEGRYAEAESMYAEAIRMTPKKDENYQPLVDRLAATVYKQGEQAKAAGNMAEAAGLFMRVGTIAPTSSIRATAEFDAAAIMIAEKNWSAAIQMLEGFQKNHPGHELQKDVSDRLAAVYLESGNTVAAASQLQKIAADKQDPEFQRDAMWQSAELYEKGDALDKAVETYKAYVKKYPQPLTRATEARQKLIELYGKLGQTNSQVFWQKELVASIPATSTGADSRGRLLAAQAAFALAEPTYTAFSQVQLKQPLKQTLTRKKQMMDEALKAYNQAADYRIAEITTASTYRIGQLYFEFSKAILGSERPAGMSDEALAQYELVLEEQAIPLEEKAIEVHSANAERVGSGIYDEWVRKSFGDLAKLMPARYGKVEKYATTFTEIN